jgi:hypothetical protein
MLTGTESLSLMVIESVADAERVDPAELSTPLTDAIDPDALDALFRSETGRLAFEYSGYEIIAKADGTVDVTPLPRA